MPYFLNRRNRAESYSTHLPDGYLDLERLNRAATYLRSHNLATLPSRGPYERFFTFHRPHVYQLKDEEGHIFRLTCTPAGLQVHLPSGDIAHAA